jgi:hypothetical protein
MGHAVPMPVVVKTRSYDSDLYSALGYTGDEPPAERQEFGSSNKRRLR